MVSFGPREAQIHSEPPAPLSAHLLLSSASRSGTIAISVPSVKSEGEGWLQCCASAPPAAFRVL